MATALQVARYFLGASSTGKITDLKLQKLCSYAQAISIAYLGKKLFDDHIEMWELGPVVRNVYNEYKKYDNRPIPPVKLNMTPFSKEQRLVLAAVNDYYGKKFGAWELCEQSHSDFPGKRGSNTRLSKKVLKQAFEDNPLVQTLKRASEKDMPPPAEHMLSEKEFWDAVSA